MTVGRTSAFVIVLACSACGDAPVRSEPPVVVPAGFSRPGGVTPSGRLWWSTFADPELQALVEAALAGNPGLDEVWARLEQALASARAAGAALRPSLEATASASAADSEHGVLPPARRGAAPTQTGATSHDYQLGLACSWEIDLWGRVRATRGAAVRTARAAEDEVAAAAMSLTAEVALRWVRQAEAAEQVRLIHAQTAVASAQRELLAGRRDQGLASLADLRQAEAALAGLEAQRPLAEARLALLGHELALLLGRPPSGAPMPDASVREPPGLPAVGVPAGLLASRPDLRAAWQRLLAVDDQLAAAKADRLPALRLTAGAGFRNPEADQVFDVWYTNLLAGLLAPIFDGGRRAAEVRRVEGVVRERAATYRRLVLTALREVEDALVQEARQVEHLQALDRQLVAAVAAADLAEQRFRNGATDYLPVLLAQADLRRLERDRATRRRERIEYRIQLHRALGDGGRGDDDGPQGPQEEAR